MRLLARVRDDLGTMPSSIPFRLHSDKGQEFLPKSLERFCELHGIRRTTTAGYDPSANGAGEQAIGYIKRKTRQLLTGARLPTTWWGVAALTAAHYSRCVAGLEAWPTLGFGTRVMVVRDPPDRNAFTPRSMPATVFGPAERVSGGYVVYQEGRLREVANITSTNLASEEIVYIKGHLHEWDSPAAPMQPPLPQTYDPALIGDPSQAVQGMPDRDDRDEGPRKEEKPAENLERVDEELQVGSEEDDLQFDAGSDGGQL